MPLANEDRAFLNDTSAFILHALELRRSADAGEQRFMDFLMEGEHLEHLWRPGAATYDRFLDHHHICKPARYRNWVCAKTDLDNATVEAIGVNGAVQAVRVSDPAKRCQAVREMVLTAEKEGVPLSEQTAEAISRRYRDVVPNVIRRADRMQTLEEENHRLRAEIRRLNSENADLKKKLAKATSKRSSKGAAAARPS